VLRAESLTQKVLKDVFDGAILAVLEPPKSVAKAQKKTGGKEAKDRAAQQQRDEKHDKANAAERLRNEKARAVRQKQLGQRLDDGKYNEARSLISGWRASDSSPQMQIKDMVSTALQAFSVY